MPLRCCPYGSRISIRQARKATRKSPPFTTIADSARKSGFYARFGRKKPLSTAQCMVRAGCKAAADTCARPRILRHPMDEEPKSAAEMKEIRLNRKRTQDAEGIKAMADIAAADIAIRKRTENLRAIRLAKEAADRAKPVEAKIKAKPKNTTKKKKLS